MISNQTEHGKNGFADPKCFRAFGKRALDVYMGWGQPDRMLGRYFSTMDKHPIQGGVAALLADSCCRNRSYQRRDL